MKINWDHVFKDDNGNAIVMGENKEPATLKKLSINALLKADDAKDSGVYKRKRWLLANKLMGAVEAEITTISNEEREIIKDVMGRGYTTLVVGPAWDILEGKEPHALN